MSSLLVTEPRPAPPLERRSPARPVRYVRPDKATKALFPLPLSPFENLFLLEDSPAYPIQFFGRLRFRGRLRTNEMNQALGIVLARHPLLTAIVQPEKDGRLCWMPCRDFVPRVDCVRQEPAESFPSATRLDIRVRP